MNFEPWVGADYGHRGRFGLPLLVLGESHYDENDNRENGAQLTKILTQRYIDGDWRHPFWTRVAKVVGECQDREEAREWFWSSVTFYNYIQEFVGTGPRDMPTYSQWQSARRAFRTVLDCLRPAIVVVLGKRLWMNVEFPDSHSLPLAEAVMKGALCRFHVAGVDLSIAVQINHPSSVGFSYADWRPIIRHALVIVANKQ